MLMFCIAFTQTTSDWSISNDCANVIYNQRFKIYIFFYFKLLIIIFLFDTDSYFGIFYDTNVVFFWNGFITFYSS